MALALEAYGAPGYEVRAFETRTGALRNAAVAIQPDRLAGHPARLAGRAHLGDDRVPADADPSVFRDAKIEGAYILDPWYPRVSSIWGRPTRRGRSRTAEMKRNFLQWKRPRAGIPDRDGLYITVARPCDLRLALSAGRPLGDAGAGAGVGRHPPDPPGQDRDEQRTAHGAPQPGTSSGIARTSRLGPRAGRSTIVTANPTTVAPTCHSVWWVA